MDKLIDDIESKRNKKNEKINKRNNVQKYKKILNLMFHFLNISRMIESDNSDQSSENENKKIKIENPKKTPAVMTLDLSSNGKWRLNSSTD